MNNPGSLQTLGLHEGWFFRRTREWSRRWYGRWLRKSGFEAFGAPWQDQPGPFLFAATHASHLDFWAVLEGLPPGVRETTYVAAARDYFYEQPARRLLTRLGSYHNFPFRRGTPSPEEFRRLAAILHAGFSLLIFPQGTRSRDGRPLPFKPLAAMLALETGAALVPVAVRGTWEALPAGRLWPRHYPIRVAFGDPLPRPAAQSPVSRQARAWTGALQHRVEWLWDQLAGAPITLAR